MDNNFFNAEKKKIIMQGLKELYENYFEEREIEFILGLLLVFYSYSYDNRLDKKGLLTFIIKDKDLLKGLPLISDLLNFDSQIK